MYGSWYLSVAFQSNVVSLNSGLSELGCCMYWSGIVKCISCPPDCHYCCFGSLHCCLNYCLCHALFSQPLFLSFMEAVLCVFLFSIFLSALYETSFLLLLTQYNGYLHWRMITRLVTSESFLLYTKCDLHILCVCECECMYKNSFIHNYGIIDGTTIAMCLCMPLAAIGMVCYWLTVSCLWYVYIRILYINGYFCVNVRCTIYIITLMLAMTLAMVW